LSNGQLNGHLGVPSSFVWDVTAARAWSMADFDPAVDLDFVVKPKKLGVWDDVGLFIDALGLRVRSSGACDDPSLGPGPDLFLTKDDGFATVLPGQYLT